MKYTALTILTLVLLLSGIKTAFADSINLNIYPSVTKIIAKPGTSPTLHFTLKNNGDPTLIKVEVLPFKPADNLGHIRLEKDLKVPVKFVMETSSGVINGPFLLKSNASQDVKLTLQIDKDSVEKDYYFTFLAETLPFPASEGETTLQVASRVGSNIILSVTNTGRLDKDVSIGLLNIVPQNFSIFQTEIYDNFQKIPFILSLNNNGRNVIKPQIAVSVNGWNQHKKFLLTPETILANSQRVITDSFAGFYIGTYALSVSVSNGDGTQVVTKSTSFTTFPFVIVFFILIITIAFFIIRSKHSDQKLSDRRI